MAEKSRLDLEGIRYRKEEIPGKNRYADEINPYDENNEDVLAKNSTAKNGLGKGTGQAMGYAVRNLEAPKTQMNYSVLNTTEEAGGYYDKFGTKGIDHAYQGDAGREWAKAINTYSSNKSYGKDSVEIDLNERGQYVVIR